MKTQKSNDKAELIRGKGYQLYLGGQYYEALLRYNRALCFAEPNTKVVGLLYANRADVYFKLNLFDKCLKNIRKAREEHCPAGKFERLDLLEEECLDVVDEKNEKENPWKYFKLSYPTNECLPYVVDCLEVKSDQKYGRYVITNQALKIGDVIAIEKPIFKFLKTDPDDDEYPESNMFTFCANCLMDNLMDLIPCSSCVTTMFCSTKCHQEADKRFHQYECNLDEIFKEVENWRMALRCFFEALAVCDESIEELEEMFNEDASSTIFDFDFSDPRDKSNARNQLKCMMALARKVVVKSKNVSQVFQHHPKLIEIWAKHQEFIMKFLKRMMQIEILNFHGIKGRSLNRSDPYRSCVGDGGFAFCSLLNHSCCANVMRIVVENRMVIIVERPIQPGEQIFDSYIGDSFYFKSKNSRQMELMDYQFVCDCNACQFEYPEVLREELESIDNVLCRYAKKEYEQLRDPRKSLSHDEAFQLAYKFANIMQRNYREQNYPCREIVLLELCIIKCFLTLSKSTINFP